MSGTILSDATSEVPGRLEVIHYPSQQVIVGSKAREIGTD
jgi:hypothetical protein